MKLRSKLVALVGAGALVLGIAGTAFADGTVTWTGNGVTDGQLNTVDCDSSGGQPYLYWVLSPAEGITGAELFINGQDQGAMSDLTGGDNGHKALKIVTSWFDLGSMTAYANVTGGNDKAKLKISHGCPGEETSSTTSFTSSESSESTSTSETTSFVSSESSESTTLPNTATIGNTGSSGMSNSLWMLLAGIGVVGGSILVLMPARAKGKR